MKTTSPSDAVADNSWRCDALVATYSFEIIHLNKTLPFTRISCHHRVFCSFIEVNYSFLCAKLRRLSATFVINKCAITQGVFTPTRLNTLHKCCLMATGPAWKSCSCYISTLRYTVEHIVTYCRFNFFCHLVLPGWPGFYCLQFKVSN